MAYTKNYSGMLEGQLLKNVKKNPFESELPLEIIDELLYAI